MQITREQEKYTQKVVSVILPAYNEAESIPFTIERVCNTLNGSGWDYELLVVDDGSIDATAEKAREAANGRRVKVFRYSRNRGKGHAIAYGLSHSRGGVIVFMDSDLDISHSQIGRYVEALENADMAIASKRHPQSTVEVPSLRRFLSFGFNVFVRLLTGLELSDTQSGMKAARADVLKHLMPLVSVKKYAFDVELLVAAKLLHLRVVELPVDIKLGAQFGVRPFIRIIVDTLGIAYRLRIKHWYQANLDNPTAEYKPLVRW